MKKKIISAIALVSAVILTLGCATGCGKKGKTVDDIKKAGELVIATSPDFPPFEELKSNGAVEGIEIDIMNIICEKLGVTLKIEQMDFDSVLPGVQAGKYDVGVSGISVTEKRQKNTLFTDPYCLAAQAIVVTEGSSITCKADLEGKKVDDVLIVLLFLSFKGELYRLCDFYKFELYDFSVAFLYVVHFRYLLYVNSELLLLQCLCCPIYR